MVIVITIGLILNWFIDNVGVYGYCYGYDYGYGNDYGLWVMDYGLRVIDYGLWLLLWFMVYGYSYCFC